MNKILMNTKEKIGFKLIRLQGTERKIKSSLFTSGRILYYGIGRKTEPKGLDGPLGVFISKEHARSCYNQVPRDREFVRLYRCKYKPSEKKSFWIEDGKGNLLKREEHNIPEGTDFASSVTLLEEVKI